MTAYALTGSSIGPFSLGDPLNKTIAAIRRTASLGKCTIFSRPEDRFVVVELTDLGFRLLFGAKTHRLHMIDVVDVSRARITHDSVTVVGGRESATLSRLHSLFGPSEPGWYETDDVAGCRVFNLQYPGLCLGFKVSDRENSTMPFENASTGESPVCVRLRVFAGKDIRIETEPNPTDQSPETIVVLPGTTSASVPPGPTTVLLQRGPGHRVEISRNTTPQDLLTELGNPIDTFDRIEAFDPENGSGNDVYMNYFDLGFDVLIDGATQHAKRVIFHTNWPNDHLFGTYERTNIVFVDGPVHLRDKFEPIAPSSTSAQAQNQQVQLQQQQQQPQSSQQQAQQSGKTANRPPSRDGSKKSASKPPTPTPPHQTQQQNSQQQQQQQQPQLSPVASRHLAASPSPGTAGSSAAGSGGNLLPLAMLPFGKWSEITAALPAGLVEGPMIYRDENLAKKPTQFFRVDACIFEILDNDTIASLSVRL